MSDAAPPPWVTHATIADRWGRVTPRRVCQVARYLDLGRSKHHRRVVDGVAQYSPAAVGLIEREFRSRGYSEPRNCDNVDCPAQGTGPCDCGPLAPAR